MLKVNSLDTDSQGLTLDFPLLNIPRRPFLSLLKLAVLELMESRKIRNKYILKKEGEEVERIYRGQLCIYAFKVKPAKLSVR